MSAPAGTHGALSTRRAAIQRVLDVAAAPNTWQRAAELVAAANGSDPRMALIALVAARCDGAGLPFSFDNADLLLSDLTDA